MVLSWEASNCTTGGPVSCYNWERGTITTPASAWAGLKKDVRDAYNRHQDEMLALAGRIHDRLIADGRGKRGFNYREAFNGLCFSVATGRPDPIWRSARATVTDVDQDAVQQSLFRERSGNAPLKPRRMDFPHANGSTTSIERGEAYIAFNNTARAVSYGVGENNRAIEYARRDPIVQYLFARLAKVRWTRSSGGVIVGNDEYNRDNECAGGGANYITAHFGPLGEREAGAPSRTHRSAKTQAGSSWSTGATRSRGIPPW
jgi:hypothetical protein